MKTEVLPRLAMFDLDGTLYDTVRANHAAYAAALARQGFALSYEAFADGCNGRYYKDFLPGLIGAENCTEELLAAVHRDKTAFYRENLHLVRENGPLYAMLRALRAGGWRTAIVTTAARENVRALLRHFGRERDFDLVIAREDVQKGKPDPEGYRKAMAHFGAEPKDCIAFEDAREGMAAALAATPNVFRSYAFITPDLSGEETKNG